MIPDVFERLRSGLPPAGAHRGVWLYVGFVALLAMVLVAGRPIVAVDHDLFFHMAHGRALVESGEIPSQSYFSFLEPVREGVNYYWLFQPLVHGAWLLGDETGVVVLRALLFGALMACVGLFLFRGSRRLAGSGRVWLALAFALTVVYHLQRTPAIRPHSVSFLMIALFLVLLDRGGRWLWALPPLAVLWVNVHGIEFPVMLLLLGACLADLLLERWRAGAAGEPSALAALGVAMAAVFATPHGFALVRLPFQSTGSISRVIEEMERLPWSAYLRLDVSPAGLSADTVFNLLLALALVSALLAALRRQLPPSAGLLLAGGVVLLTQGYRFTFECTLLALPALRAGARVLGEAAAPAGGRGPGPRRVAFGTLALVALVLPVLSLASQLRTTRDAWPLSLENVPHGVASFLQRPGLPGRDDSRRLMCPPRLGGYFFWSLYPRYRISMDLEMAFLFSERDLFEVESAYRDPAALARYLERWQPDFIAAALESRSFPGLIRAHPRYRPVFLDDTAVLYVDAERHPDLAREWRLAAVQPFALGSTRFPALPPEARERMRRELERLAGIDGRIVIVQQSLAILANLDGRAQDALGHAAAVIERDPLAATGYALAGDAFTGLGRPAEAESSYRLALRRVRDADQRRSLRLSLAGVLSARGRFDAAYEAFVAAVGELGVDLPARELYRLGILAARSGRPDKARRFLELARIKTSPGDADGLRQIDGALAALGGKSPSAAEQ